MDRFWKAALGVAGIGAVAFFVFYSLYRRWLDLPIFKQLTQDQTFVVMLVFLGLTFFALLAGLIAWLRRHRGVESEDAALHRLEQAWSNVNYINCDKLVGPDVNKAANALQMTAVYWRQGYLRKEVLLEKYGAQYCEVFDQLNGCNKAVPGYTHPKKHVADFLPAPVRSSYQDIKAALKR